MDFIKTNESPFLLKVLISIIDLFLKICILIICKK